MTKNSQCFSFISKHLRGFCFWLASSFLVMLVGCGSAPTNRPAEVDANFDGLYRFNVPGLPTTAQSSFSGLPQNYQACESNLATAVRIPPLQQYINSADVAAYIDSLRELIGQRYGLVDEYGLWLEQAKRLPEYERIEKMELNIEVWKKLGWKLDDPGLQRRIVDQGNRDDIVSLQYYLRGQKNGGTIEENALYAQMRSNRKFLEKWDFEVSDGVLTDRSFIKLDRIYLSALQRLNQSGVAAIDLNSGLREIEAFRALALRCMDTAPKVMMLSKVSIPPNRYLDRKESLKRLLPGQKEMKALRVPIQSTYAILSKRAIEETSKAFLAELKNTRSSMEVPGVLIRFYGPGDLGKSARSHPAITPGYEAQLGKLQAAEEAARQAALAKIKAIEAREAEERAKDLKRRIAGNLAPTTQQVESVITSVSAEESKKEVRKQVDRVSHNSYLLYSDLFGNRITSGELTLSVDNLNCRAKGNNQSCTWTEHSYWTRYSLFGKIEGSRSDATKERSGVFQWTADGLVAVGKVDVTSIEIVVVSTSRGGSSGGSISNGQSLQDTFMDRELDNRQNYFDSVQRSGYSSFSAPYDPSKNY